MKKTKFWNLKMAMLAGIAAVVACGASQAHAQLINFDTPGGAGATNYSGSAAIGTAGDFWNPVTQNGTTASGTLSDGLTSSAITLSETQNGTYGTPGAGQSPLLGPYAYANNNNVQTLTLNNVPNGTYNLYLYGTNLDGDRGTSFTIGGVTQSTVNTPAGVSSFIAGSTYVEFASLAVTTGSIGITWATNSSVIGNGSHGWTGNNQEGDFNGLQLQVAAVPEPKTWASMLLGLGLLGLIMRHRTRRLQS